MTILEHFRKRQAVFLDELRELVAIETPTGDAHRLNDAAEWLAERLAPFGDLTRTAISGHGTLLHLHRPGTENRVMLSGHLDTVWPVGAWSELWREADGRIYGPGIYDMKGGLLFIAELLRWLEQTGARHPTLDVVINPDEETGSTGSRSAIRTTAAASDLALVLEPATIDGSLKLARKGSGEIGVVVYGRPAHQGVEPELGVNAVVEAAHLVLRLLDLEASELGTTVGPNVVRGGTASNVVADRVELLVDLRAWTTAEQRRLDQAITGLEPVLDGARIEITGGWNRPPMESSAASLAVFERARSIGAGLGLDLEWVRWGGSSDANLTAAAGTPTVDGLGPVGEGSHQKTESIVIDALPARLALFVELVASLAEPVV